MRADTVVDTLAERFGLSRSEIMDTSIAGGDMAVRLAIGEAKIVQENADYFRSHGVNLQAIESHFSGNNAARRSTTTLLVKNLPHDTNELELESMFTRFGGVAHFLIPASRSVALVDFIEPSEARLAFNGLAYRKYKHLPLYIEWAPMDVISSKSKKTGTSSSQSCEDDHKISMVDVSALEDDDVSDFGSLFIKNLNFSSTEDGLRSHLLRLGCRSIRAVSLPKKRKGDALLSMGYGFVEFRSVEAMTASLGRINGSVLDSHALEAKPSDKRISVAPTSFVKSKQSPARGGEEQNLTSYKLLVRNLAFQASQKELNSLFSAFGQVKKIRIPKKNGSTHRGFAFVDFATHQVNYFLFTYVISMF